MKIVPLKSIIIAEGRQRQEFDAEAMQELTDSIEQRGLFHPPVIRQVDGKPTLVAGERRLRAITQIFDLGGCFTYAGALFTANEGRVPVTDIGQLSPLEAEEIELDENIKRKDLTWQELADTHARLHKLRQSQKEIAAVDQRLAVPVPQTIADTTREIHGTTSGYLQDTVRKEVIIAQHLDNPVVAKAKSLDDAWKILKRQDEAKRNMALAVEVGKSFSADDHKLFNVDCLNWMSAEVMKPDGMRFDVILTDPPYGMGADQFGNAAGKLTGIEHHYDDSYGAWKELMGAWTTLSFLIAKPQAHAYVFCDIDNFHELRELMRAAGWYVFRTPLINIKRNSGRVPLPDRGPRRQWEAILYAIKGDKRVNQIYPDLVESTADESMAHGAQKPVEVYQNLLARSVRPGDFVLDSFAGSGTIFPACHASKCYAVGLEQSQEYYGMGLRRIQSLRNLETPALF